MQDCSVAPTGLKYFAVMEQGLHPCLKSIVPMGLILWFCAISYIIAKVFEPFVFFDVLVMLYLLRNLRFLREPYTQISVSFRSFRIFSRISVSFREFP